MPDVFARLHGSVDGLTTTSDAFGGQDEPPELKAQVETLIEAAQIQAGVAQSMIKRLFPAAERHLPSGSHYDSDWESGWLKERRVAHEGILRLYLERVTGDTLKAFYEAEQAWSRFEDRAALDTYLRSIDLSRVQDVIGSLETYEDQFAPEQVIPATIVLLNLLPDLPQKGHGMFEIGTTMVVCRVTYRLLRSMTNSEAVQEAVQQILPELTTLSSKLALITQVGHREGTGDRLVSEGADKAFLKSWREEVRRASVEQFVKEWDLLGALSAAKFEADASEKDVDISASPDMTLAILRAARGEAVHQPVESRAERRFPRLDWGALIKLYGDKSALRQRVEALRAVRPCDADAAALLDLADKYLGGWRPNEFGDE